MLWLARSVGVCSPHQGHSLKIKGSNRRFQQKCSQTPGRTGAIRKTPRCWDVTEFCILTMSGRAGEVPEKSFSTKNHPSPCKIFSFPPWPPFRCSVATWGSWLPYWKAQLSLKEQRHLHKESQHHDGPHQSPGTAATL